MRMIFFLFVISAGAAIAQHHHEAASQDIKSLSAEEITGFSQGLGMGQAKPAELNGYPGPKHLLERKVELNLTEHQISALKQLQTEMTASAIKYGTDVMESERSLNTLFAGGNANEESLDAAVRKVELAKANVRLAHLRTHLAAKKIVIDEQLKKYYNK